MAILLLPLMSLSENLAADLKGAIGNSLLCKVDYVKGVPKLPDAAYDKKREQYDVERVLLFVHEQSKHLLGEKVIAVGNIDLFLGDMSFVFGTAQTGGRIGIVSTYRLDQRFYGKPFSYEKLRDRAIKEVLHELGHSYGLPHCSKDCVMAFSVNVMEVDTKPRFFCEDCREKLRAAFYKK